MNLEIQLIHTGLFRLAPRQIPVCGYYVRAAAAVLTSVDTLGVCSLVGAHLRQASCELTQFGICPPLLWTVPFVG